MHGIPWSEKSHPLRSSQSFSGSCMLPGIDKLVNHGLIAGIEPSHLLQLLSTLATHHNGTQSYCAVDWDCATCITFLDGPRACWAPQIFGVQNGARQYVDHPFFASRGSRESILTSLEPNFTKWTRLQRVHKGATAAGQERPVTMYLSFRWFLQRTAWSWTGYPVDSNNRGAKQTSPPRPPGNRDWLLERWAAKVRNVQLSSLSKRARAPTDKQLC